MSDSIRALVEDTLSGRRLSGNSPDSCFVVNEAARELERQGERALPEIENAIRRCIGPNPDYISDHNQVIETYPGLLRLWLAYYHIAEDRHIDRVVDFLESLDGPVLATGIVAVNSNWPDEKGRSRIPRRLSDFIRKVASQSTGSPAVVAQYYLE